MGKTAELRGHFFLYVGLILALPPALELLFGVFGIKALMERFGAPFFSDPAWARIPDWPVWTWSVVGLGMMIPFIAILLLHILEELHKVNLSLNAIHEGKVAETQW
jgi:hypothetical protein